MTTVEWDGRAIICGRAELMIEYLLAQGALFSAEDETTFRETVAQPLRPSFVVNSSLAGGSGSVLLQQLQEGHYPQLKPLPWQTSTQQDVVAWQVHCHRKVATHHFFAVQFQETSKYITTKQPVHNLLLFIN